MREKASAAYGVGRDSIADALPVDCQVSTFFATSIWSEDRPVKKVAPGTSRFGVFGALGVGRRRRPQHRPEGPMQFVGRIAAPAPDQNTRRIVGCRARSDKGDKVRTAGGVGAQECRNCLTTAW
ncbi:MAG: hypothetical protein DRJ61_03405 [Acidobacteria bacterium]|nr:MAG: hypothetical protein DRJ61_03405 [Acidobacteriota bacterium]